MNGLPVASTEWLPDPLLSGLRNELWDRQGADKKCFNGVIMGKGDHCAVFGCNNDRGYPEKQFVLMSAYFDFTHRLTQKIKVSGSSVLGIFSRGVVEAHKSDINVLCESALIGLGRNVLLNTCTTHTFVNL